MLVCPVCGMKTEFLSTNHIRAHGYATAKDFKTSFGLEFLRSERIRKAQSERMKISNPTSGGHSSSSIAKMCANRKGKGLGFAGKYERTPEIRAKISRGVSEANLRHKYGAHILIRSPKLICGFAYVRSTWEARMAAVFDRALLIRSYEVEPFTIPYEFEGVRYRFIPDFLVLADGITEVWEVKGDHLEKNPKTQAKKSALHKYVESREMHAVWVNYQLLCFFERGVGIVS